MSGESSLLDDLRDHFSPEYHAAPLEALYEQTGNLRYKAAADALRIVPAKPGQPSMDKADEPALRAMISLLVSGRANSRREAARIVAQDLPGHSFEATVARLDRKFRQRGLDKDVEFQRQLLKTFGRQNAMKTAFEKIARDQDAAASAIAKFGADQAAAASSVAALSSFAQTFMNSIKR